MTFSAQRKKKVLKKRKSENSSHFHLFIITPLYSLMQNNIDRIDIGKKQIILVGTAHISKDSIELVKKTIEKEKPDTVCVELCKSRYDSITKRKRWEDTKITELIRDKKAYLFLSNLLLANFEKKMGEQVKVKPGSEMIEAINVAKKWL